MEKWENPDYWFLYKYFCNVEVIPVIAKRVANIIKSIFGKNKKLLALELDNTIWGGGIGDDGVEKIQIGMETSKGEAFLEFQKYCKELRKLGVLLAIDSKNDESNALLGLEHPEGVMRYDPIFDT